MKYFTQIFALTGLVASLGTGAFAQDVDPATVTCGDFMAMSAEDQSAALEALKTAQMDADTGGAMATDDADSTDSASSTDSATSTDTETSTDSATSGTDTSSSDTATAAETDSVSSTTDTERSDDAMADPEMEALKTSCEGNDEALVMDQMGSM